MTEYKDTLNLPKTGFPMKANLAQREPGILKRWDQEQVYQKIRTARAGRDKFILHDGPPYANGEIHLGHALNKVLKDIIVKARTLDGYDCPYVPGWDCHGLPIEHKVETKIGKAGVKVEPSLFRQKCREYALRQVDGQRKDFIRLGVFGDWDNPYLTVDHKTEADIIRAMGKIVDSGHLVRGYKPVYWSVVGGSALAEAEVEYKDKVSHSIDVRFAVANEQEFLTAAGGGEGEGPLSVVIWTTTPWTLPSNQAVSLHPTLDYQILQSETHNGPERLVLASELVETAMSRFGIENYQTLATFKGEVVERQLLQHPFYATQVPIILGEHVTTEAGTGAVHTAPDHGLDDFIVGQAYGLDALHRVNDQGYFTESTELFAGEHVYKVDEKVIEVLQQQKTLVHAEQFTHSFPHCWRTKTPLIYRATPQWFISMTSNDLMGQVKDAVANVEWHPDWGRARMDAMLDSSPDWCISRQRTWGVPITLFINKEDQSLHPNTLELIEQVAERVEKEGMDAWFESSIDEWLDAEDASNYTKSTDTLDVWFDSGVTHYSVLNQREDLAFPADLYLEGSDQHRGWFQSSLKTSMAINGRPPYKAVLTHGFTVDAQGRKQSKSLGNVVSPQKVTNQLGADVLRLWVAATDFSGEMTCTDDILKQVSDSYRRIRNTVRYLLSGLDGFEPTTDLVPAEEMLALDRWALDRAAALQEEIIELYQTYNFHQIYQRLHNFCTLDMGGFYLDILKDRLYTCKRDGLARRSAQTALYHLAEAMVRWITPILSFTADEIWSFMPGERDDSVFVAEWYQQLPRLSDGPMDAEFWQQVMTIKTAVNRELEAARVSGTIGGSLDAEVTLYCDAGMAETLAKLEDELRFVLITSKATLVNGGEGLGAATDVAGLRVLIAPATAHKCTRCWHHREDVGENADHPEICSRCIENIEGDGETRLYA